MKNSLSRCRSFVSLLAAPVLLVVCAAQAGAASLQVDIVFSILGDGAFRYDLTVSNSGPEDVPLLSINDAPANEARIGSTITVPTGFAGSYDPIGFIDFAGTTSSFSSGSMISGFSFESAAAPGTAFNDFSAFTNEGQPATVTTTIVPEPASSMAAALGLIVAMMRRRR